MAENDDFQGFSEDFGAFLPQKPTLSREEEEALAGMQKRLLRIERAMPLYQRNAPRALREEAEILRSNIAHFKRRNGLTD